MKILDLTKLVDLTKLDDLDKLLRQCGVSIPEGSVVTRIEFEEHPDKYSEDTTLNVRMKIYCTTAQTE